MVEPTPEILEEIASNFDILHPAVADEPDELYKVYDIMRTRCPFSPTTSGRAAQTWATSEQVWVSTRYEETFEVLRNWKTFSSGRVPGSGVMGRDILMMDPPEQQHLRKILNPYFTRDAVAEFEPAIRTCVSDRLDEFIETGKGDLGHVAWTMPGIVLFNELLNLPLELAALSLSHLDATRDGDAFDVSGLSAVASILENQIQERMNQPPRGDVIDAILGSEVNGHPMEFRDMVAMCVLLVLAGLETTSNALACAYYFLGQHDQERDRLVTDPTLLDGAIEEFVRYSGSVHGLPRVATTDVVVGGHEFHPGDTLVINWAAANRDPKAFGDADQCMIDRRENRHLGFGAGVHRCLGSNLARLEMRVGLEEVLRRMPDYRSDPDVPARFSGGVNTRGFVEVPVVFTPSLRLNADSPRP